MKLENQVCNLELAKRLKELGVKQESFFYWFLPKFKNTPGYIYWMTPSKKKVNPYHFSAFTVAELGEMLPKRMGPKLSHLVFRAGAESDGMKWMVYYSDSKSQIETANSEADARALMLIYLIEQGLVKL